MAAKRASGAAKSSRAFGQARKSAKMFRVGLYARVSTNDQQTIPLQILALREYGTRRGYTVALQVKEVGSGASQGRLRKKPVDGGPLPEIDVGLLADPKKPLVPVCTSDDHSSSSGVAGRTSSESTKRTSSGRSDRRSTPRIRYRPEGSSCQGLTSGL